MEKPSFVYTTYIQTTPERLWKALTEPEFTERYWSITFDSDWRTGSTMTWHQRGVTIAEIKNMQFAGLTNFTAKAHTPTAQDATLLIEQHSIADIEPLLMFAARLTGTGETAAEAHRVVLQPAFAGLVAYRTVQRMIN